MSNEQALSPQDLAFQHWQAVADRHKLMIATKPGRADWPATEAVIDALLTFASPSPARDEVLEEAALVADRHVPEGRNGAEAGAAAIAGVEIAESIRALKSQPPSTWGGRLSDDDWHKLREQMRAAVEDNVGPLPSAKLDCIADAAMHALDDFEATIPSAPPSTVGEDETARLMHVIDRDRYAAAIVLNNIKKVLAGYSWLSEAGRGSYAYDDERYQREFGDALEAIEAALTPLGRLAFDKTDCTTDPDKVHTARQAGVERVAQLASEMVGNS